MSNKSDEINIEELIRNKKRPKNTENTVHSVKTKKQKKQSVLKWRKINSTYKL